MGREIAAIALDDSAVRLIGAIEASRHPRLGKDIGGVCGRGDCGCLIQPEVKNIKVDTAVIIDFTAPAASMALLGQLKGSSARLVIGTTALSTQEQSRVQEFAKSTAVVFSPNMSLGVNLLFHLTDIVARRLGASFDIEIIEAHHRHKKDAPSGTARKLGEVAAAGAGLVYDSAVRNGRAGMVGERTNAEIGMHAIRGGDIVGDHTVLFAGNGERLELRHMAHSRTPLAAGAIAAAKWVSDKKPGLYSMKDVWGL
jgi:4-hydroxy-tetrahydrodipicolinate reductase